LIQIGRDEKLANSAYKIYNDLLDKGVEVLYDDRQDVSVGVKFNEADLIGIPYRLVISEKTKGKIELKRRDDKEAKLISIKEAVKILTKK
jgi:prolyl-tRNA synthetase